MFTLSRSNRVNQYSFLLLALGLAIVVLLSLTAVTHSENTAVWMQPPSTPVHIGDTITVTVRISDVVNFYGAQFKLHYPPADLQIIDADSGTSGVQIMSGDCPLADFTTLNAADNSTGVIDYAVSQMNPTPPVSGDCVIAYIQFQTQQVTTTAVSLSDVILSDPNGVPIAATLADTAVTILPLAPAAAFSATPTSGIAPLDVQFSNLTTGEADSWVWDFGDGTTSTQYEPSHLFTDIGTYTIMLTTTGTGGNNTVVKTNYITVLPEPDDSHMIYLPVIVRP